MRFPVWAALGALLLAVPGVQAQQVSRTPDPADPAAPVPPTAYQSALTSAPPSQKEAPTPDQAWRAANASVASPTDHGAHSAPPSAPRKDAAPQQTHQHH